MSHYLNTPRRTERQVVQDLAYQIWRTGCTAREAMVAALAAVGRPPSDIPWLMSRRKR